jgi:hypothetical protein
MAEQCFGKAPTRVRFSTAAPVLPMLSERGEICILALAGSTPAVGSMVELAEWIRHRVVAPVTGVRFSYSTPSLGFGTAWSGHPACTRDNSRVQISGGPPNLLWQL